MGIMKYLPTINGYQELQRYRILDLTKWFFLGGVLFVCFWLGFFVFVFWGGFGFFGFFFYEQLQNHQHSLL